MQNPTKQKILLVEDEASIREMYTFKLKAHGYDMRVTENGKDGLKIAEEWQPDIILLDLNMPRMSGDKMLEILRGTEWGSKIRVIILTNISKSEAPSKLRFLDVDRYIVKAHTTPSQIIKHIEETLD